METKLKNVLDIFDFFAPHNGSSIVYYTTIVV